MSFSTYTSDLSGAFGIVFDNSDNLYVADYVNNNVVKVDGSGNQSIFATGFNYTENLVFDNVGFPSGYMYVMDSSDTIYKVDANGNKTVFFTGLGSHYFGLAIDASNNLYYGNTSNNIYKIDTGGNKTTFIDGSGTLSFPLGLKFDNFGNLLIANYNNQYISKYDSNGNLVNGQFITASGAKWYNLVVDKNNNIYATYATSTVNNSEYINKYDQNGTLISAIYDDTTVSTTGLAVDSVNNLYFTNNNSTVITKYTIPVPVPCFKEDTKILTDKGYVLIQELRNGHLIKTLKHGYKPIFMIGKRDIVHEASQQRIKNQLYKCSQNEYPEIIEPLVITGCHSILVDNFTDESQKNKTAEVNGKIYVTDNKYRLPACADHRASVYETPGTYTIYHLALENDDYYMNYGIYANGLLVETCSKRFLKELSNMTLIE